MFKAEIYIHKYHESDTFVDHTTIQSNPFECDFEELLELITFYILPITYATGPVDINELIWPVDFKWEEDDNLYVYMPNWNISTDGCYIIKFSRI